MFNGGLHAEVRPAGAADLHELVCSRCGYTRKLDVAKLPGTEWLCPDCKDLDAPILEVFGPTTNVKHDRLLRGLERAKDIWHLSAVADRKERMVLAHELHAFEMFSLNQLAKICRLSVPTVCRKLTKNATGGRFQPEVLSSLVFIRKTVILGERLPNSIVRTAASSGTSVSTIARLTGASETTLYIKAGNTNTRSAA
jgi:hypothetical protein